MSAKPITVTVLRADGSTAGTIDVLPTNPLWRATRRAPHVHIHRRGRDLQRLGDGWALRLAPGEAVPASFKRRAA